MVKAVLPSTAKAFRFDIAYDLDQKEVRYLNSGILSLFTLFLA